MNVFTNSIRTLSLMVFVQLSLSSTVLKAEAPPVEFGLGQVSLHTKGGRVHEFNVEIAKSYAQHMRGLMFRTSLAANTGMIFIYQPARPVGMWMKNTEIPLDMVFANGLGVVTYIAQNTIPHDETVIQAPGLSVFVLELAAGTLARLGIGLGDRLKLDP